MAAQRFAALGENPQLYVEVPPVDPQAPPVVTQRRLNAIVSGTSALQAFHHTLRVAEGIHRDFFPNVTPDDRWQELIDAGRESRHAANRAREAQSAYRDTQPTIDIS